jgi:putative inorganic carbon (HCO3(-)) transporter
MTLSAHQPVQIRRIGPVMLIGIGLAGLTLAGVASLVSVYAAAVPFALAYMALTYVRPDLAIMVMFASAPYCYDLGLGPAKMALSDVCLMLALPILLLRAGNPMPRYVSTLVPGAIALYFIVCVVSTVLNGQIASGLTSLIQMAVYLGLAAFVFSSCIDDERVMYAGLYGLIAAGCVLAMVKVSSSDLYVLGLHKNSIGASLSFATTATFEMWIGSAGLRRRRRVLLVAMILLMLGLLASLSRGAWLGTMVGVMAILLLRAQFKLVLRLALIAIPVLAAGWLMLPDDAREYATDFDSQSHNIKARYISLEFAYSIFESSPVLGVGVGLRKQYDATNVMMSTLAETGVVGAAAFVSIFGAFAWSVWQARRRIGPQHRVFPLLAIGMALVAGKLVHGMVDHFWSRGVFPVWAGMGMAMFACHVTRDDGNNRRRQG